MRLQVFPDNEWLYPDTELTDCSTAVSLDSARGPNDSFQVLTELVVTGKTAVDFQWVITCEDNITIIPYQLLPAHVEENSGEKLFTTLDYESVKNFVTRKAPFDVYCLCRAPLPQLLS